MYADDQGGLGRLLPLANWFGQAREPSAHVQMQIRIRASSGFISKFELERGSFIRKLEAGFAGERFSSGAGQAKDGAPLALQICFPLDDDDADEIAGRDHESALLFG